MVIGSLKELLEKTKKSGNTYFVMRHAEAGHNVEGVDDPTGDPANHVTEKGRTDAIHVATVGLKRGSIDLIVTSPFLRTRETAALVQKELRLPESAVMVDERLREASETAHIEVRRRIGEFIFEIERRYTGKRILIISHGNPLWVLQQVAARRPSNDFSKEYMLKTSEVRKLSFTPFPHNKDYGLDLHRPYIDAVTLVDSKGRGYERIPEVVDCWVESGTMPYASNHYPFENKEVFNPGRLWGLWPKGFPAHFIAEYIAQTRTWFYYMHAMGILLSNQQSFRNVVSTGTILAADGSKMSKSKGNYTDPLQIMDQFGADALRLYLMGSVVMSGEDINFRDEDVREAHNRTIGILWNSYKFFELYKSEWDKSVKAENSPHVLDRWVLSLLG
ncbi:MAG TPA: class I tRNA ligase family protein, partial [Candidatus Paceibacterota bacterium]|nr:class I tRNA ligase family protein [Candidatus Paceibacterota bacterium]